MGVGAASPTPETETIVFLSIEWNSIRLSGPARGIVTKAVHKTLPGGRGDGGQVGRGDGGQGGRGDGIQGGRGGGDPRGKGWWGSRWE